MFCSEINDDLILHVYMCKKHLGSHSETKCLLCFPGGKSFVLRTNAATEASPTTLPVSQFITLLVPFRLGEVNHVLTSNMQ